jgi:ubiquinone/menaquinone biosynthesis methyltransferase
MRAAEQRPGLRPRECLLSFGCDCAWKKDLIHSILPLNRPRCLDIARDTGNLCELFAMKYSDAEIVGLDLTEAMLNIARARVPDPRVTFRAGDMCQMDFPDASFDIVTGGYALRNAPDLKRALSEIRRVLKPDGNAAILDFSESPSKRFQTLENFALGFWGGLVACFFTATRKSIAISRPACASFRIARPFINCCKKTASRASNPAHSSSA